MALPVPNTLKLTRPAAVRFYSPEPIRTMQGAELDRFLLDFGTEDIRQSRELWQKYAGRGDLVSPESGARRYRLTPRSLRYVEVQRGGRERLIPQSQIRNDVERFTLGVQREQREIAARLTAGLITPQEWYDETARLMKLSHRAVVDVARGTGEEMNEDEKKEWLLLLLLLFLLFNDIADDLDDGEILISWLPSINARRAASIRSVFKNWRFGMAKRRGAREARRLLNVADHCETSADREGCVELAEMGWVPISQFVPFGGATCRDNCKCDFEFR